MDGRLLRAACPDLAPLAARVASHHDLDTLIQAGVSWPAHLELVYPRLRVVDAASRRASRADPTRSAIVVNGGGLTNEAVDDALDSLGTIVEEAALVVITSSDGDAVVRRLADRGSTPTFVGTTRRAEAIDDRIGLVIIDRIVSRPLPPIPDDFRVVAVMTVYNEEDVLARSIEKLVADGVDVHVIDNWSSDRSFEIAQGVRGRGVVDCERYPDTPAMTYQWERLLRRVEDLAAGIGADWIIHHDADERRSGPWPGVGLRDALWRVQQAGFSAVDHTVLNFRPVDDSFVSGSDFERHFRHFEFGRSRDLMVQVNAWRNVGRIDLASTSGHEARFAGRRIFPYKFLLKHYPVRSQAHGERKVLRDRVGRWDAAERARGWHVHYDEAARQPSFLRRAEELIEFRDDTPATFLAELVAGAGLADLPYPAWALRNRGSRALYRGTRRLLQGTGYERLRELRLLRPAIVRRPLGRLRSLLLEGRRPGSQR